MKKNKMSEQNPLQITSLPIAYEKRNPKGRPRKLQSVTFSAQPRSIVSQILEKMINENKIALPLGWNSEENTTNSAIVDEDHSNTPEVDQSFHLNTHPEKRHISKNSIKISPKIYSCNFSNCLYSSKLSSNLHKHRRTHTGEKPYLCDRCSFRTNFSNSLKVHKRLHTAERPYQCTCCDYRCNSISNLKKHSHTKHKIIMPQNDQIERNQNVTP